MRAHVRFVVGVLCVTTGCVRAGLGSEPTAESSRIRFEAPLTFEAAGGRVLPVPMAVVSIRGRATRLIVDTGASDHVLTRAFAAEVGLASKGSGEKGTDHAGASFDAAPLEHTELTLGTTPLGFDSFAVEGPPPFQPLGIGGFLSPQRLLGAGYLVLDFPRAKLVALDTDAAGAQSFLGPSTSLVTTWVNHKPFVEVALVGQPAVQGELDTGGSASEVSVAYAGVALDGGGCQGIGVSGSCVEGGTLEKQALQFAGAAFPGLTLGVRQTIAHGPGLANEKALLGMDVLRKCVLAVPMDRKSPVLARCAP